VVNSVLARWGVQTRETQIQSLCLSSISSGSVVAALRNNIVKEVEFKKGKAGHFHTSEKDIMEGSQSAIVSLCKSPVDDGGERLVSCSQDGWIECFRSDSNIPNKFEVGGPVERMRGCSGTSTVAIGGKENDLSLWDLSTQQCTFRARNVPHDKLDMRVPIWVTDMAFPKLQGGTKQDNNMVWTCTGYGQIRVYDVRTQRRPVRSKKLNNFGHLKTILSVDDTNLVVGDVQGHLARFDVATMRINGHFKGFTGGIRSLDIHPSKPLLASCGLDRIVRVHHLSTRKVVGEVYVKQKLTDVKFCPAFDLPDPGNHSLEEHIGKKRKHIKVTSRTRKAGRGSNNDDDEIVDLDVDNSSDSEDDAEEESDGTISNDDDEDTSDSGNI